MNGGSQLYKSEYLKEKMNMQNEKRRNDKKNRKNLPIVKTNAAVIIGTKDTIAKIRPRRDNSDDLEEVIDELKNDLRLRDMEYDELKLAFA